jgi:hypothetical protein
MATYEGNCYEILSWVRRSLNEYSTAYVQGTDTSGIFSNAFIIDQINDSQKQLYNILLRYIPEEFLETASITGSNSVFSLPWNFGRAVQFRDENGYPVLPAVAKNLPPDAQLSGSSDRLYYRKGQTFVVFQSGVSATYKLYYRKSPREIHAGVASAGGAQSLTLDATYAKRVADYYNGMDMENVTDLSIDTITDYTAALVATISGTGASSDYYGIVSELPDAFHHLIAPRALMLCKERHPVSQVAISPAELQIWQNQLKDALSAFGYDEDKVSPEDIWTDFGTDPGFGVNIPGQGYLIY